MAENESVNAAIEQLQKKHIFFATPCYNGVMTEPCFRSYMRFAMLGMKYNIPFTVETVMNESLITRGRNNLMAKFLATEHATHLMWVDADIAWNPEDVMRMVLYDAPVICGLYPAKGLPTRYVLNPLSGGQKIGPLIQVSTAGTGFMLIKREVILKLIELMPETKFKDSVNFGKAYEPFMYALFDTMIDEHGHYLSEDWTFCKRVIEKLNVPIWVDTDVKLDHMGSFMFEGNTDEIKKLAENWGTIAQHADELANGTAGTNT